MRNNVIKCPEVEVSQSGIPHNTSGPPPHQWTGFKTLKYFKNKGINDLHMVNSDRCRSVILSDVSAEIGAINHFLHLQHLPSFSFFDSLVSESSYLYSCHHMSPLNSKCHQ